MVYKVCRQASRFTLLASLLFAFPLTILLALPSVAHARGFDEVPLDAAALAHLQQQAEHAQPREQCYLYTQLLHGLTELAGRQMRAGDDADVDATLQRVSRIAALVQQASSTDAKRLKQVEQLLDHTDQRLSDMARVASDQTRVATQAAWHRVDRVHTGVLALVFAH